MTNRDKIKETQEQLDEINALVTIEGWNELTHQQVAYITHTKKGLEMRLDFLKELPATPEVGDRVRVLGDMTGTVQIGVGHDSLLLVRLDGALGFAWVHDENCVVLPKEKEPEQTHRPAVTCLVAAIVLILIAAYVAVYFHVRVNAPEQLAVPLSDTVGRIPDDIIR